jgi:predicted  nucleic acid-binding Zn-ribbon protein
MAIFNSGPADQMVFCRLKIDEIKRAIETEKDAQELLALQKELDSWQKRAANAAAEQLRKTGGTGST